VQELTESNCPFVIKAYGTTQDDENLYFITEFVPGGELYSFLQEYGVLPEEQARFYAGQMVLALRHMHEQHNMVYRDIKPENMLLDRDGYVDRIRSRLAMRHPMLMLIVCTRRYIKLIDFGFAKKLTRERSITAELKKTFTYVGTPEYMVSAAVVLTHFPARLSAHCAVVCAGAGEGWARRPHGGRRPLGAWGLDLRAADRQRPFPRMYATNRRSLLGAVPR
jgi:hypothetical protein